MPEDHPERPERPDPTAPPPYPDGHDLLAGRSVLITAAAGTGIGYATARRCAEEGARVVMSDQHEERLQTYADRLAEDTGALAAAIPCDVTDQDQVTALFGAASDAVGTIDVVVNNAGLGGMAPIVEMTDDQWHRVLDVTLTGTFRCTREALRHMLDAGGGAIVNNASVLGWRAQAGQAHYASAKAGVMALTRTAAMEGADAGVRVNAVSPSLAIHENLQKVFPAEQLEAMEDAEAFGRGAEPWEVANVIVFLASDLASYMTGEVVAVSSQHP